MDYSERNEFLFCFENVSVINAEVSLTAHSIISIFTSVCKKHFQPKILQVRNIFHSGIMS